MKVRYFGIQSVNSQAIFMKFSKPYFLLIWHRSCKFRKKYWLDHLICSKCPFTTLLYNMYKPIKFIPVYSQNCVTCQMVEIFRVVAKWLDNNDCKISWQTLENWLTGYQKANFYSGPSSTVGQTVEEVQNHTDQTGFIFDRDQLIFFKLKKY